MKKKSRIIIAVLSIFLVVSFIVGCIKQLVGTVHSYDQVILKLPNGELIEGEVESWKDYNGEQLQVRVNGKYYLVNSANCILISE